MNVIRNILVFFGSIILPILILAGLSYVVFNRDKPTKVETPISILSEKSLEYVYDNINISKQIRNIIESDLENLNQRNCKGILEIDQNDKNYFTTTSLITKKIKLNKIKKGSSIIIYYNACLYNYSDSKPIELIGTTEYILNNDIKKGERGEKFFKAYSMKSEINKKNPILKKVYAPLEIIITNR